MGAVCWLEDRDDRLARARALAGGDLAAALALVDSVLAEVPDDLDALRARAEILADSGDLAGARQALERLVTLDAADARALIDLADLERDAAAALGLYERAIAILERRGCPAGDDLTAAHRGRARCLAD
jgi:tetratricopeptide (TPR) repeat protein